MPGELGLGYKAIGQRVGLAASTMRDCVRRVEAAGLVWPLADELTDRVLSERLHGDCWCSLVEIP